MKVSIPQNYKLFTKYFHSINSVATSSAKFWAYHNTFRCGFSFQDTHSLVKRKQQQNFKYINK